MSRTYRDEGGTWWLVRQHHGENLGPWTIPGAEPSDLLKSATSPDFYVIEKLNSPDHGNWVFVEAVKSVAQ